MSTPTGQANIAYLTNLCEPHNCVRRLGALTGALGRLQARQAEAQYLVTNLVPLLQADIAATTIPVNIAGATAVIAGLQAGLAQTASDVNGATAAIAAEQAAQQANAAALAAAQTANA